MGAPAYDQIDNFYINFVDAGLATSHTLFYQTVEYLLAMIGDVGGQRVLDLCCGEGHVARMLAEQGANVTGIDLSEFNIGIAEERNQRINNPGMRPTYLVDDAQTLSTLGEGSFDLVVCKMALMDVPDISAAFQSVARVLAPGGTFIAALLHPCFETPFAVPFERIEQDSGNFVSLRVQRYFEEGHWQSGGTGVRGHVGAFHRTVSTYINELIGVGFRVARLAEPQLQAGFVGSAEAQMSQHVPRILFWEATLENVPNLRLKSTDARRFRS